MLHCMGPGVKLGVTQLAVERNIIGGEMGVNPKLNEPYLSTGEV